MKKQNHFFAKALVLLTVFTSSVLTLFACEIEITVEEKSKKQVYKNGDEVVVLIRITKSHRSCTVGIEETKFKTDGLKIMGATEWKETQSKIWERKVKLQVTGAPSGKLSFNVSRTCTKEDNSNTLTLTNTK